MKFFSRSVDKTLKNKIYRELQNTPEESVETLKSNVRNNLENENFSTIKDYIDVLKQMFKDKLPAKPKYFGLQVIQEIMHSEQKPVVTYFIDKINDRLAELALFEPKNNDIRKGERCLDEYYKSKDKENAVYSLNFYKLLLKCWKEWDDKHSAKHKKIREKLLKIRPVFDQFKDDVGVASSQRSLAKEAEGFGDFEEDEDDIKGMSASAEKSKTYDQGKSKGSSILGLKEKSKPIVTNLGTHSEISGTSKPKTSGNQRRPHDQI